LKFRIVFAFMLLTLLLATRSDDKGLLYPTPDSAAMPSLVSLEATKAPRLPGDDPALQSSPVNVEVQPDMMTGNFTSTRQLNLPAGFGVKLFVTGLQYVRQAAFSPDRPLFVNDAASMSIHRIYYNGSQ